MTKRRKTYLVNLSSETGRKVRSLAARLRGKGKSNMEKILKKRDERLKEWRKWWL